MRYDLLIICLVFLLWAYYLWRFKYKEHFHSPNWTGEEYFQHIREKHPDIWEEYLKEE